ncbi:hypothetical protein CTU88_14350 [Streptomyces sp. JV178]|nr:hypothetical protein CTU88_14350 [Streptomyces sp. JV178]
MVRVQGILADVSRGDAQDGYPCGFGYLAFQAAQVRIDGLGFPACVGENGLVDLWENTVG